MKSTIITVFTPTYNRAYILPKLFESLKKQTCKEFEWLIVDDGSTDQTENVVNSFDSQDMFQIRYIKKENEGKPLAINTAANEARGEWLFIVDSDDTLTIDAIDFAKKYCKTIENDENFAGVVGLRGNSQEKVWTSKDLAVDQSSNEILKKDFIDATALEYRYRLKIKGDRAEVIRVSVLKKYPFPKFEKENFIPEAYLWYSLSVDGYKFRWFNKVIYITEYLEDGLTKNGRQVARKNPRSRSFYENFALTLDGIPLRERIKGSINYFRYGYLSGKTYAELYKEGNGGVLKVFALPIAIITKIERSKRWL